MTAHEPLFQGKYVPPPAPDSGKFVIQRNSLPGGYPRAPFVFSVEELAALVEEGQRLLDAYIDHGLD